MNPDQTNNGLPPLPTQAGGQPQPTPQPSNQSAGATTPKPSSGGSSSPWATGIVPLAGSNNVPPQPVPTVSQAPVPVAPEPAQPVTPAPVPPQPMAQPMSGGMPPLPPEPPEPTEPVKPALNVRPSRGGAEWNSTPWIVGIFFMVVLVAVLALIAINLYSQPLGGTNTTTSSSISSSTSSAADTYGFVLTNAEYHETEQIWSYQIDGNLPTPCHTAAAEVVVRESFPEQVSINVTLSPPEGDAACAQVLETITLTGSFTASSQASVELGQVTLETTGQ